jgi:hypothetical protein
MKRAVKQGINDSCSYCHFCTRLSQTDIFAIAIYEIFVKDIFIMLKYQVPSLKVPYMIILKLYICIGQGFFTFKTSYQSTTCR